MLLRKNIWQIESVSFNHIYRLLFVLLLTVASLNIQAQRRDIKSDTIIEVERQFSVQIVAPSVREVDFRTRLKYEFKDEKMRKFIKELNVSLDEKNDTIDVRRAIIVSHVFDQVANKLSKLNIEVVDPEEAVVEVTTEILLEFADELNLDSSVMRGLAIQHQKDYKNVLVNAGVIYDILDKDSVIDKELFIDNLLDTNLIQVDLGFNIQDLANDTSIIRDLVIEHGQEDRQVVNGLKYLVRAKDTVIQKQIVMDVIDDPLFKNVDVFLNLVKLANDTSVHKVSVIDVTAFDGTTAVVNDLAYRTSQKDTVIKKTFSIDRLNEKSLYNVDFDLVFKKLAKDTSLLRFLSVDVTTETKKPVVAINDLKYIISTKDTVLDRQLLLDRFGEDEYNLVNSIEIQKLGEDTSLLKTQTLDVTKFDGEVVGILNQLSYQIPTKDTVFDKDVVLDVVNAPTSLKIEQVLLIEDLGNDTSLFLVESIQMTKKYNSDIIANEVVYTIDSKDTILFKEPSLSITTARYTEGDVFLNIEALANDTSLKRSTRVDVLSSDKSLALQAPLIEINSNDSIAIRSLDMDVVSISDEDILVRDKSISYTIKSSKEVIDSRKLKLDLESVLDYDISYEVLIDIPERDTILKSTINFP